MQQDIIKQDIIKLYQKAQEYGLSLSVFVIAYVASFFWELLIQADGWAEVFRALLIIPVVVMVFYFLIDMVKAKIKPSISVLSHLIVLVALFEFNSLIYYAIALMASFIFMFFERLRVFGVLLFSISPSYMWLLHSIMANNDQMILTIMSIAALFIAFSRNFKPELKSILFINALLIMTFNQQAVAVFQDNFHQGVYISLFLLTPLYYVMINHAKK